MKVLSKYITTMNGSFLLHRTLLCQYFLHVPKNITFKPIFYIFYCIILRVKLFHLFRQNLPEPSTGPAASTASVALCCVESSLCELQWRMFLIPGFPFRSASIHWSDHLGQPTANIGEQSILKVCHGELWWSYVLYGDSRERKVNCTLKTEKWPEAQTIDPYAFKPMYSHQDWSALRLKRPP